MDINEPDRLCKDRHACNSQKIYDLQKQIADLQLERDFVRGVLEGMGKRLSMLDNRTMGQFFVGGAGSPASNPMTDDLRWNADNGKS
jgi:hypothetical protein